MNIFNSITFGSLLLLGLFSCKPKPQKSDSMEGSANQSTQSETTNLIGNSNTFLNDSVIARSERTPMFLIDSNRVVIPGLYIEAGKSYLLDKSSITIGQLTMEDNSELKIANNLPFTDYFILSSFIGKNCKIITKSNDGNNAPHDPNDPASGRWWQAKAGQDGKTGVSGLKGGRGGNGIDINVTMKINQLDGELLIISQGGNGGTGSTGGKGQIGGNCAGGHSCGKGGRGGDGGLGGEGGNGGNINLKLLKSSTFKGIIALDSHPGNGNFGGKGGDNAPGGTACIGAPCRTNPRGIDHDKDKAIDGIKKEEKREFIKDFPESLKIQRLIKLINSQAK